MASDITLAVGDGTRRMTYAELATRDPAIRALEHTVEGLCEQLEDANQQAERAEERANRAEQRADLLQVKFEAGALAERIARDWQPLIRHEPDEGQLRLDLAEPAQGRDAEARPGFTPWW
jgi:hypothetical protein